MPANQKVTDFYSRNDIRNDVQKAAFYQTICQLGRAVQEKTYTVLSKRFRSIKTIVGIKASLVAATCIHSSQWGIHPLAQDRYYASPEQWFYANNLLMWEADSYWHGDVIPFENKTFKSFRTWGDFAIHTSDLYSWSDVYARVMCMPSLGDQLKQVSLFNENPDRIHGTLWRIIRVFNLESIDVA
jgi:hypothetical protein